MNIEAINTMIDKFIRLDKAPLPEHPDRGFNMYNVAFLPSDYTQHKCGTAACLLGWERSLEIKISVEGSVLRYASVSAQLFTPDTNTGCAYSYIKNPEVFTLRAAIRVLQILRDTGRVDWSEAIANPWAPETETRAPSFDGRAWLDSMIDPTMDAAIPLLEGPKRKTEDAA